MPNFGTGFHGVWSELALLGTLRFLHIWSSALGMKISSFLVPPPPLLQTLTIPDSDITECQ